MNPFTRWLLPIAAVLAFGCTGSTARAQDDDEPEDQMIPPTATFVVNEMNFNQWAFGDQSGAKSIRARQVALLSLKVEEVARLCQITEDQKKKLQLAGRVDIKRLFEPVAEKQQKYLNTAQDPNKLGEIIQDLQTLQRAFSADPFGDHSFYQKTLKTILSADQFRRYAQALGEQKQYRYRAKVELAVAMLDQAVGFSEDQRRRLVKLLLEETVPPKKFGNYDYQVILIQLARLPEDKLKPLFDELQWDLLSRQLDRPRMMEPTLRMQGVLPDSVPPEQPARLPRRLLRP